MVMVLMTTAAVLEQTDEFLHTEEGENSPDHPQTDYQILSMIMVVVLRRMAMMFRIEMIEVLHHLQRVRDQVEERVSQETTGCERQEHVEQTAVLGQIRNEPEQDKWGQTYDEYRTEHLHPQLLRRLDAFPVTLVSGGGGILVRRTDSVGGEGEAQRKMITREKARALSQKPQTNKKTHRPAVY